MHILGYPYNDQLAFSSDVITGLSDLFIGRAALT
jgi:hypothetical protein